MPMTPGAACPTPKTDQSTVLLGHGGGGALMHRLIDQCFLAAFGAPDLAERHDGAVLDLGGARLAFTTDSYVVHPLFFPGGDIGTLAVNGTVNDLAMCGARPRALSAAFILEEGLPLETLTRVVASMCAAADAAGVQIVTGDTKVVDRGRGDGLFVTTAGVGLLEHPATLAPGQIRPGDAILVNGDLGRHGIAVMAVREGLAFDGPIASDCAPLADLILELLAEGIALHCARDLTRGGLTSALVELATASRGHFQVAERDVPVSEIVQGACEILGLDPFSVACEGRMVLFVKSSDAPRALALLAAHPHGQGAAVIGRVTARWPAGTVTVTSPIGTDRVLEMLSGEQLPRIC